MVLFKTITEVSRDYNIPLSTVYYRVLKHHYRVNDYNEVLVADIEAYEQKGIKAGRPKGVKDRCKRKQRKMEEK